MDAEASSIAYMTEQILNLQRELKQEQQKVADLHKQRRADKASVPHNDNDTDTPDVRKIPEVSATVQANTSVMSQGSGLSEAGGDDSAEDSNGSEYFFDCTVCAQCCTQRTIPVLI